MKGKILGVLYSASRSAAGELGGFSEVIIGWVFFEKSSYFVQEGQEKCIFPGGEGFEPS